MSFYRDKDPMIWMYIVVLGVFLAVVMFMMLSCAKPMTLASTVVYQGDLQGNYKSADDVVAVVNAVKDCMGLHDRDFPLPKIVGMSGGNAVQCGDYMKKGCYTPGTIIVPDGMELDIIAHEAVHHYLFLSTGDLDANHTSKFFLLCGGKFKLE